MDEGELEPPVYNSTVLNIGDNFACIHLVTT
jgi:hypothetical protein